MKLTTALVLAALVLTAGCSGARTQTESACEPPPAGQVLAACDPAGSIVISLGTRDGMRPGDSLLVSRDGNVVSSIIIHQVSDTQAAGTVVGGAGQGAIRPGDKVTKDD